MESKATEQFFGLSFGLSPSLTKPKVLASAWIFSAVLDPFADCLSDASEAKKKNYAVSEKKNKTGTINKFTKNIAHVSVREKNMQTKLFFQTC